MKNIKWWIILINLILLLVYFNGSIISKEDLLKNGKLILLELAPVDPRSLMQGDYMSLRYKISEGLKSDSLAKQGYCVVKQDA
ncbi:MAG TPA: GDYXXLXY domain-containing protein, partial [Saprospiraceae bacterium]|nr:GDYXXLXY domain-containing protein [Saprospiraceae bacterium]